MRLFFSMAEYLDLQSSQSGLWLVTPCVATKRHPQPGVALFLCTR